MGCRSRGRQAGWTTWRSTPDRGCIGPPGAEGGPFGEAGPEVRQTRISRAGNVKRGGFAPDAHREGIMDPVEGYSRWQRWTVSGTAEAISKLLNLLDASLTAGWKRLSGSDLLPFQPLDTPGSAWYALA